MTKDLKTILLDAINDDLSSSTYEHQIICNLTYKDWSDIEKFQWAFDRFMIEVGSHNSLEYWFSGLALPVPYMNYEIEQLGFNPETFFKDLGTPNGSKPFNRCLESLFFPLKLTDRYQSCHP